MNQSISDTFDNISFTASGQLFNKHKNEQSSSGYKQLGVSESLKISFDDSAFFNASFSSCQSQKETEKENVPASVAEAAKTPNKSGSLFQATKAIITPSKPKLLKSNSSKLVESSNNRKSVLESKESSSSCVTPKNIKRCSALVSTSSLSEKKPNFASTPNVTPKKVEPTLIETQTYQFSQSEEHKLSILGLPAEILQKYECRNVRRIFPWQLECLSCDGVLDEGKNLVYSAPTSAGKTLVAEILAVKTVLERNKKVIFILPFVSVVREKMFYFQDIFGSSGIRVEGFMGSYNPPGGFKNVNVAICTIEKANSLVNRLLEERKLADIGAVIVDELHLIGDPSRGYLLELLLTKLNYISRQDDGVKIQIIGMSATLPNLNLLGQWLDAALYVTTFRPIPLNEQCLVAGEVFNSAFALTRRLEAIPELETDTDNVLQLCLETLLQSCSVLIFCPTKNWCENLAVQIATAFFKIGRSQTPLGADLRNHLPVEPIKECLEQLKRSPSGLDDVLQKTVSFGVAFHHAGLTMDERDIIEGSFRTGGLRILVATSTLSSGVNLPARRVIIRTPTFFGKPIEILSYKQMVGRAGRMGKDTAGESILICQKKDLAVARELIKGELEPITSCLESSGRLMRALLEIIASGVASTPDEIDSFGRCTLLNQEGTSMGNPITDALDFLIKYQFVRLQVPQGNDVASHYVATPLAKACLNSSMPPEEGLTLFAELEKARQCFVLETELHLLYLVTPYSAQINTIDWMQFLEMWEKLPASMKRVGELIGIKVSFIINCSRGKAPNNSGKLAVHRRFYTALALQDLVNEVPLNDVAQRYNCNRGALQGLQQSAAAFAGRVTTFSKQLGWSSVELLVGQFQDRLQFGVGRELLDLMRLPILNGQRARVLFDAGVEGLVDLAGCNLLDLENILHKAKPFESKERDGESKHEAEKRNNLRTIFITGKRGLTELEAARLMIADARKYLQYEMGLSDAKWSQGKTEKEPATEPETETEKVPSVLRTSPSPPPSESFNKTLDKTSRSIVNVSVDDDGNLSLEPFEISTSPKPNKTVQIITMANERETSLKEDLDDFDLTSLRLSSSSSTTSPTKNAITPSYNLRSQPKTNNLSSDSLFDDSFNAKLVLMQTVSGTDDQEEQLPEPLLESDSLLSKAFMDSFNESLTLKTNQNSSATHVATVNKSINIPSLNINNKEIKDKKGRKRHSDEIYSGSSSPSDSSVSDGEMFISPSPKQSRISSKSKNEDLYDDNEVDADLKLEMINVCATDLLFTTFLDELMKQQTISFSVGCVKYEEEKKVIGIRKSMKPKAKFTYKTVRIHGFSMFWPREPETNTTYYVELEKLLELGYNGKGDSDALKVLEAEILKKTLRIFNAKEQLKFLSFCLGWKIDDVKIEDPRIADWLLDPESTEKTVANMVKSYSPGHEEFLNLTEQKGPNEVGPKLRASLCALINWSLVENAVQRLRAEDPQFMPCYESEMKIIVILTKMELNGMPVNVKTLQSFADSLKSHIQALETEAFNIAGRRFSFASPAAVSKVLNMRGKGKRKISTCKAALVQYDHPLADIIIQWRKINSTLTKMIYPLLRNIDDARIRGTCITHNSTGRVSMHEPNLQNVPRDFHFVAPTTGRKHEICIRGAFSVDSTASGKTILVAADYCQLELRLLAHLSNDQSLGKIMRSDCDIFKAIASQWMKIKEEDVDDTLRQQTKQICYGIIYGIGNKTLADQMSITEEEALDFTETFHQKYPGIRQFVKSTVEKCARDGFVETLLGRRRYLPMINSSNQVEKSKAERQAVNTTVQGSAADIAKQAMILVDKKVAEKFRNSRNVPKLILQLHDELLYEVPVKYEDVFARILRKCMQESVKLNVPLPVKVQCGKSWGTLVLKE